MQCHFGNRCQCQPGARPRCQHSSSSCWREARCLFGQRGNTFHEHVGGTLHLNNFSLVASRPTVDTRAAQQPHTLPERGLHPGRGFVLPLGKLGNSHIPAMAGLQTALYNSKLFPGLFVQQGRTASSAPRQACRPLQGWQPRRTSALQQRCVSAAPSG